MSNVARLPEPAQGPEKRKQSDKGDDIRAEQACLLALIADVLETNVLDSAVDALAGSVQHHLGCHQVAIALLQRDTLVLQAISKQAFVDPSSSESTLIVDAMQEACDREAVVRWPLASADNRQELGVLIAHRALAGRRRSISYCSVPIYHEHRLLGERRVGFVFTQKQQALCEKIAIVAAPLLALRLQADQGILAICRARLGDTLTLHLGTDRPGRRVLLGLMTTLLLAATLIPVDSHIRARAELLPLERRLITAPRAGFVQSVDVVIGEEVESGQLLATLDARDLELEASRSASEIATAEVEFRAAMASFDRQASVVARARLAQARAQQMLVQRQLDQNSVTAPLAGLVLTADPANTLGAPVSRGDTLFEIAPADGYEVHLLLDQSDIRDVFVGQTGELTLRARPDEVLPVSVQSIHPIAESGNGASRFRVRASLTDNDDNRASMLRPGESGHARLDAGKENLMAKFLGPLWRRVSELKWRLIG